MVSCKAAFHHFPRPDRVLAEMRRVAKADGRLLVADMLGSEDPACAAYQDRIERLCDPTHVRALPRSEFERMFAAAGLAVLAAPSGSMDYDVDEWMAPRRSSVSSKRRWKPPAPGSRSAAKAAGCASATASCRFS